MKNNQNITIFCDGEYLSTLQIKYDCETLLSLTSAFDVDGVVALSVIPYVSLVANSVLEIINPKTRNGIPYSKEIKDVRLKLKFFTDGYSRSKRMILNIDHLQNETFKKQGDGSLLNNKNLHCNLGIYINKDMIVLGNTQYFCYLLQDDRMLKKNLSEVCAAYKTSPESFNLIEQAENDLFEYGRICGEIIGGTCKALTNYDNTISIKSKSHPIDIYGVDINTNTSELFTSKESDKGAVLYLLHILSTLNSLLYILNSFEQDDYGWWLKTNYITYYYSIMKLKSLQAYYNQNKPIPDELSNLFKELNLDNAPYLNGIFRNYVMHSRFVDKDNFIINKAYLNKTKPLFGLVETCFDGKSYDEIKLSVISEMNRISDILAQWLNINLLSRKAL